MKPGLSQSFRWLREAGGWEDSEVTEEPPILPEHNSQVQDTLSQEFLVVDKE